MNGVLSRFRLTCHPELTMSPSARRVAFVAVAVLSNACSGDPADRVVNDADYQGPSVVVLDPVLLEESDEYYLGNPSSLIVDTLDGSFLVSDHYSGRMFRLPQRSTSCTWRSRHPITIETTCSSPGADG